MENILELQQICKSFPKSNFILDKLSFSLPYGLFWALLMKMAQVKLPRLAVF